MQMRDVYANEVAKAVHDGRDPDPFAVASWARYDTEAASPIPCEELRRPPAQDDDDLSH